MCTGRKDFMRIKHFAGYGLVKATKVKDPKHTLHIKVVGNHECGIALNKGDDYLLFEWLVSKFDKTMEYDEWRHLLTKVSMDTDYTGPEETIDYLIDYDKCQHEDTVVIDKEESYKVLYDEYVTITAKVRVCQDCGRELFDPKLDEENHLIACEQYKVEKGLLSSGEIKSIRESLGISWGTMDKLLSCGHDMSYKYEKGAIQPIKDDILLRLLQQENVARMMADIPYLGLTEEERKQLLG